MSGNTSPGRYRDVAARTIAEQPNVRAAVTSATDHSNVNRSRAYAAIDAERWRDWARDTKTHLLTHLDRYLEQAERSLLRNGARVHWVLGRRTLSER